MDIRPAESDRPQRIGIFPVPGFAALSYAATVEPFRAANTLNRRQLYEVVNISRDGAPVPSSGAVQVAAQARIGAEGRLDCLFLVAGGDPLAFDDAGVLAWLARKARAGLVLGGVSGGPAILARAGLMTGRRMTVHWEHAEDLAERYPHLAIERALYVIDRDRLTCAGGTAPMDLVHALITRAHGAGFARRVSDWFMHTEIRAAKAPQRSGPVAQLGGGSPVLLAAAQAMEDHIADPLDLPQLARVAGISPRQLTRLFRARTGRAAMRHYREMRLDKARDLLRASTLTLTEIALATGFSDSAHFSRSFAARFGHPPSAERRVPDGLSATPKRP